jgi:limonene-1,2-epoxide hydrolase
MDADTVVTKFMKLWDATPTAEQLAPFFTDDAFYHNIPMEPVVGREAICASLGGMQMQSMGWEVKHQVAQGNTVMNERVDRFKIGEKTVAVRVAGIFEVRDGKIASWRDYFDLAEFMKQMA